MARYATLRSLREQALQRADMVHSDFVTSVEVNEFVNQSYAELYDFLVNTAQDYNLSSAAIPVVSGTDTYDLATYAPDFYKVRGADVDVGDTLPLNLIPFTFEERNMWPNDGTWGLGCPIRYRLYGNSITFIPKPTGSFTVTLWYHPAPGRMNGDLDTVDGVAGWEEYVVLGAAIKCLQKEESDTGALERAQAAQRQRILDVCGNRDVGHPDRVTDVDAVNLRWRRYGWTP